VELSESDFFSTGSMDTNLETFSKKFGYASKNEISGNK